MSKKKKKLLKEAFKIIFTISIKEILDKKISSDSKSHIVLPNRYKGKKAKIIIYE